MHLWPFVEEARRKGARLVTIDPYRSRTAEKSDQHLALYPGTDAALALGMMHVIFRDGLEDRDWLERYSLGHAELRERAREWTPGADGRDDGPRRDRDRGLRARVRDHAALGHPRQLRPQPPRRRRHGGAHDRVPAGGGRRLARRRRRRAALGLGHVPGRRAGAAAARPDPARHAHAQHEPARPHPERRERSIRRCKALFVYNCNPGAVAPDQERGPPRARARGPVHGRPRAVPDGHGGLRRPGAAGDDDARALRHPQGLRPPLHQPQHARDRARRRVARRTPSSSAASPARMGLDHPCLRESDEQMARQAFHWDHAAHGRASTSSGSSGRRRCGSAFPTRSARSPRAASRRRRGSASSSRTSSRPRGSIRSPATRRRARDRRARPSSPRATRSRSSRRPRTTS